MQSCRSALSISPDAGQYRGLAPAAYRCGLHLIFCANVDDACALLARRRFALVFCSDQICGGNMQTVLRALGAAAPGVPVIVISRHAEWSPCLDAMRAGAFDYLAWPLDPAETDRVVRQALAQQTPKRLHSAA